ncbi:hypothetical protein HDU78_006838 [Chytriomyces hyalinus]|nr:hypothetical protein HDU78_006838 [Chytriomyces hyalinus]
MHPSRVKSQSRYETIPASKDRPSLLLHADLAPSLEDCAVVAAYFASSHPRMFLDSFVLYLLDHTAFMTTFFTQPAPLRLVVCALASLNADPPMPPMVPVLYYARAKRAALSITDTPSLKTTQALFLIAAFALAHGQQALSVAVLKPALKMALQLQLEKERPDLPAWEQGERKRLLFRLHFHTLQSQSLSHHFAGFKLSLSRVCMPNVGAKEGSLTIRDYLCDIWSILAQFKTLHSTPPKIASDLFESPQQIKLSCELVRLLDQIPREYYLDPTPSTATVTDASLFSDFIVQMLVLDAADSAAMLLLSMNRNAAICVAQRSILFSTAFKHSRSKRSTLDAVQISYKSALCVSSLTQFILYLERGRFHTPVAEVLWVQESVLVPAMFEAAIVLWFLACRTRKEWWIHSGGDTAAKEGLQLDLACVRFALEGFLSFFQHIHYHFGRTMPATATDADGPPQMKQTLMNPFIRAVSGMLQELQQLQVNPNTPTDDASLFVQWGLEECVLSMRGVAISEEEDCVEIAAAEEPLAFCGLLGFHVCGDHWKGPSEGAWKQFWGLFLAY